LVLNAARLQALQCEVSADENQNEFGGQASLPQQSAHSSAGSSVHTPLQLRGRIFGENRGMRRLSQLQRHGELSRFVLLSPSEARTLANYAWGVDPGLSRDRRIRTAYLCAVDAISQRGLDCRVSTVTRMMRQAISGAGFTTPGLNGGEAGGWIAELLHGNLDAFERELREAANRLEQLRKS